MMSKVKQNYNLVMQFHRSIVKQQKQQYFMKRRLQMISKIEQQYPLQSQKLQKFHMIPSSQLSNYLEHIIQQLSNIQGEYLNQQQTQQLITDLLYLKNTYEQQFHLPYDFKFNKQGSFKTLATIAYFWNDLQLDQVKFWMQKMDDQLKDMVYYGIQQHYSSYAWAEDNQMIEMLLQDYPYIKGTQVAINQILKWNYNIDNFTRLLVLRIQHCFKNNIKLTTIASIQIIMKVMCRLVHKQRSIFDHLRIILNQQLQQLLQEQEKPFFTQPFVLQFNKLLSRSLEYHQAVFAQQIFQKMVIIMFESYFTRYNLPCIVQKHSQKIDTLKQSFIKRLISSIMDYLRLNYLFKNFITINKQLILRLKDLTTHQSGQHLVNLVESGYEKRRLKQSNSSYMQDDEDDDEIQI